MPRNVEIKARVADPDGLLVRARALAGSEPEIIRQTDTFFATARGRLKLRQFADGTGELIAYDRPDDQGPKTSRYAIAPCVDASAMKDLLEHLLGVTGTVEKTRRLLLTGRTRIHLDDVRGLGSFLELEVVLDPGESQQDGQQEARNIMDALGIDPADLVQGAYLDLQER